MQVLTLQLLGSVLLGSAAAERLNILHRFYHPLLEEQTFTVRGTIDPSNPVQSYQSASVDISSFESLYTQVETDAERGLYQVALERDQGEVSGWSSVKAVRYFLVCSYLKSSIIEQCHLSQASSEQFVFHTTEEPHSAPYSVDYFVSPIPHDGSCPKLSGSTAKSPFTTFFSRESSTNITRLVSLRSSQLPPLYVYQRVTYDLSYLPDLSPRLREPPPLTPQGEPVKPVPEKSFVQKYWVYIVAVLVALCKPFSNS